MVEKTVAFATLGCKLNYAETSAIARRFEERGYREARAGEIADVVYVHTCAVTGVAAKQSRQTIRRMAREHAGAFVVAAGCYAALDAEALAEIDEVDLVLGTAEKFRPFDYARDFRKRPEPIVAVGSELDFAPAASRSSDARTRGFLKIQDGCDYRCAYCAIPRARGASRSAPLPRLLDDFRRLIDDGYREIVLTGVNLGDYRDGENDLASLARALSEIEGDFRVRLGSVEPDLLSDELIETVVERPNVCAHFHLPLQSGCDRTLAKMRRRYCVADYRERLERIVERAPRAGIGADVIVGTPEETDDDFAATLAFVETAPLSYLHVFSYSVRENTPMAERRLVSPDVVKRRSALLREAGERKKATFIQTRVGGRLRVLFEGALENGIRRGFSEEYVRVAAPDAASLANRFADVRVVGVGEGEAIAEVE
jgi:threonylcarbamoyladenosine tRNA methylthiotransferase MtaB